MSKLNPTDQQLRARLDQLETAMHARLRTFTPADRLEARVVACQNAEYAAKAGKVSTVMWTALAEIGLHHVLESIEAEEKEVAQ